MKRMQKGFTLIELMIVVAIIGILAAVAIPAYQDYVVKAKLAKVASTVDSIKTAIALYYQEQGSFPIVSPATATFAAGGVATLSPAATTGTFWNSLGLTTVNLPPEIGLLRYDATAGDNFGLSITFAHVKAGTIDGESVAIGPVSTGNSVATGGANTVGASGVGSGMTSLQTYYVCSGNLDVIAKKFFNNSGTPCP